MFIINLFFSIFIDALIISCSSQGILSKFKKFFSEEKNEIPNYKVSYENERGLPNISNSCFVNVIIQFLFNINEFREQIKNFDLNKYEKISFSDKFLEIFKKQGYKNNPSKYLIVIDCLRRIFIETEKTKNTNSRDLWNYLVFMKYIFIVEKENVIIQNDFFNLEIYSSFYDDVKLVHLYYKILFFSDEEKRNGKKKDRIDPKKYLGDSSEFWSFLFKCLNLADIVSYYSKKNSTFFDCQNNDNIFFDELFKENLDYYSNYFSINIMFKNNTTHLSHCIELDTGGSENGINTFPSSEDYQKIFIENKVRDYFDVIDNEANWKINKFILIKIDDHRKYLPGNFNFPLFINLKIESEKKELFQYELIGYVRFINSPKLAHYDYMKINGREIIHFDDKKVYKYERGKGGCNEKKCLSFIAIYRRKECDTSSNEKKGK